MTRRCSSRRCFRGGNSPSGCWAASRGPGWNRSAWERSSPGPGSSTTTPSTTAGIAEEIFPAPIPEGLARRLGELAVETHRALGLRDFSRVDFRLDGNGEPSVLEANTLPGMTTRSLLPQSAAVAGISFPELCDRIAPPRRRASAVIPQRSVRPPDGRSWRPRRAPGAVTTSPFRPCRRASCPRPGRRCRFSLGLFVDAAGVPERVVGSRLPRQPRLRFHALSARGPEGIPRNRWSKRSAAPPTRCTSSMPGAHPWSLRDRSLDAALAVRVEAFEVRLSPTRTLTGVDYQAASRIALSVLASTRQHGEVHRELRADAAGHAADRWGFRGCGRGALAASQAAARAIRNTMVQLARWIGSAPELRLPPAPEMQRGTGEPRLSDPKGRSR